MRVVRSKLFHQNKMAYIDETFTKWLLNSLGLVAGMLVESFDNLRNAEDQIATWGKRAYSTWKL